jgi:molecular chaperone DnaK
MSSEDIDKAIKEAEQFAESDKVQREQVENKNAADSLAYQAEKTVKDLGDKIEKADADDINDKIIKLREAINANNQDDIKSRREELEQKLYEVSSKVYQQQAAQAQSETGDENIVDGDEVVDADYTEVDD